jgi:hypothetical protein
LGDHDIHEDPLFISSDLHNFDGHLLSNSPAINSGLQVGSLSGLIPGDDLEGQYRPLGEGVDRGAFEFTSDVPPETGSVSGDLKTSFAGHQDLSVTNATISLQGQNTYVPTTYSDGSFTFLNIEPGSYDLVISAPYLRTPVQQVTVTAGEKTIVDLPAMTILYDVNGDGNTGLREVIYILQAVSGVRPSEGTN